MSDPQGSHKEPATSSCVDEATRTTLTLSDLPPELILCIASLLEVGDLLALRRSQRSIYSATQDKLLWIDILRDLRPPLPRALRSCDLNSLSYPELEKAVLHSHMAERRWLKRRDPGLTLFTGDKHSRIRFLHILDDRWVIIIPETGPPAIWDARENPPKPYKLPESMLYAFQDETIDATAAIDPYQGDIIIGLRKVQRTPQILRAHLTEPRNDSFQLTAYADIDQLNPGRIALEPSRNAIITEIPGIGIQIGDWVHNRTVEIITSGPDDNHVSTLLLGLCLVGDYVLLIRTIWIELHLVPPSTSADGQSTFDNDPSIHRFRLKYSDYRFTGASLSEPQPNPESPSDSRIVYVLAQSTIAGFFYFRVTIYNPECAPSGPGARMKVDLVGVYEAGGPQVRRGEALGLCLALRSWLGPEGKRGVWIERSSSTLTNFVVAVSFDHSCLGVVPVESGEDLRELCKFAPWIRSTCDIFIVKPRNAYDDIVQCGFSEATGKIVLGTRDNRIILL